MDIIQGEKMNHSLPSYPAEHDLWKHLKATEKPILIYGMGNGADKILNELERLSVKVSDFFASDGFVRGHHFHGKRVLSYSEAKQKYGNFIVLLAFGTALDDVMSSILNIASEQELYAPDVPVCGGELFDSQFYNAHYTEIKKAYEALSDDTSRVVFCSVISYKLTGNIKYLLDAPEDDDTLFDYSSFEICVDAGAYRGESCAELFSKNNAIKKIYALEPDIRSYKKLSAYSESEQRVIALNMGAWSESAKAAFNSQGNRNSSFSAEGKVLTQLDSIDNILGDKKPDYIKYDVEGCEHEALIGSKNVIEKYHPSLLVCVYHRSRDIFALVNEINKSYSSYKLYMRRKKYIPAWDVYICAISSESNK